MDSKEQALYQEESLQVSKQILETLKEPVVIQPKIPAKVEAEIVKEVRVSLDQELEVNPAPFKALGKDIAGNLTALAEAIAKAIIAAKPEIVRELKVSNISDAKADEVTVKNLGELQAEIANFTKAVMQQNPVINVEKTEIRFPRSANEAIPVRLSDGKSFYNAITAAVASGSGPAAYMSSSGNPTPVQLTADGKVPVEVTGLSLDGATVSVSNEVEIKNDSGSPVPITASAIEALLTTIDADTGNLSAIATALDNRYGGGKTAVNFTVTAAGDTTIHTPASGKAVVLYSITALTDPDQSTTPLIKVLIGSTEVRRGYAVSGWEISTGAADEVLKINLDGTSSVSGTAFIKEVTP